MPKKKKTTANKAAKVRSSRSVQAPSIPTIIKRDGRIVPFDLEKIVNAIWKGMNTVNEGSMEEARVVANQVFAELIRIKRKFKNFVPTVEGCQDIVEQIKVMTPIWGKEIFEDDSFVWKENQL
jgi:hypothetical protein